MTRVSFFQYAQHESHQSWEWIDGVLDLLPPLSEPQRRMQAFLVEQISEFAEGNQYGLVVPGPFAVRMPEEMGRGREPDVLYVPNAFVETIQENYVNSHGVAMVVEIADARSRYRDHVDKFQDYQSAGIPEYWIVDVEDRRAWFYLLQRDNRYAEIEPDAQGVYHSTVLQGFTLNVLDLWRQASQA